MSTKPWDVMTPYKEFSYWFYYETDGSILIFKKQDSGELKELGNIGEFGFQFMSNEELCDIIQSDDVDILRDDWEKFSATRPEAYVGSTRSFFDKKDISKVYYQSVFAGCCMIRDNKKGKNPDDSIKHINRCLEWLDTTDFYEAPASTRYHDSEDGGLLIHTLRVMNNAVDLCKLDKFANNVNLEDAVLIALVHDWCKIGMYESYMRNVKDDNGNWVKEKNYRCKDIRRSCLGHGVSSMFLASKFLNLSVEEANAIRWHMGEYNVAPNEMNELHQANELYPLVQLIQFADRLSITRY